MDYGSSSSVRAEWLVMELQKWSDLRWLQRRSVRRENYKPHLRFVDLQYNGIKKTMSYVNFPH